MEEGTLRYWKENKIFEKSVEQNKDGQPFVFFEGPPTTNGKPGIHHVLSRVYKDIYIRYYSQKGYYVPRRAGWDCHGLPVEREVEKKLNINTKTEIEQQVGLEKFNQLCRESIMEYVEDWNVFTDRMGFWIDLDEAYFTLHNSYIESVWSLLKKIWDKGLIYQGYKVVPYDPVMGATLSDAEVNNGYRSVQDPSLTVRFKAEGDEFGPNTSFLVWTTTPWTLASNVALAVAEAEDYVLVEHSDPESGVQERFILAAALKDKVLGEGEFPVLKTFKGKELIGKRFTRLLDWLELPEGKDAFYIVAADFVTMDTGTGIVHMAPSYGVDDLAIGQEHDLPIIHGVGLDGLFFKGTPVEGQFFKDADKDIIKILKAEGKVWKSEQYKHDYPFGERSGAPLIYYAKDAWYIRTTEVREDLIKNNQTINWTPDHVKEGRFGKWLENNRDWALSRERFWGTPLPVWTDGEGKFRIIGSVKELEELCGKDIGDMDLHRPHIDSIEFKDPDTGNTMKRVPEVIDCWFDSGTMPYSQWGYPVQGEAEFKQSFPADFITEAVDQTRGWFYTLLAVSTMVSEVAPYKNVICLGHVVDIKGNKMSKSKGNTIPPDVIFDSHGADALRWYFLTGAPPGNSRRMGDPRDKKQAQQDPIKNVLAHLKTLMNSVGFFSMYANVDKIDVSEDWRNAPIKGALPFAERPEIDRWILSSLQNLIKTVTESLDKYDSLTAGRAVEEFTDLLSNWYIRRNRRRFWKGELDADKLSAYDTLFRCLTEVAVLTAPFTPFISEDIFRVLVREPLGAKAPESIHLVPWPGADLTELFDAEVLSEGNLVHLAASLGRAARKQTAVKVRQPLSVLMVHVDSEEGRQAIQKNESVLLEELNVKTMEFLDDSAGILDYRAKPNLPRLGKRLGKQLKDVNQFFGKTAGSDIALIVKKGDNLEIPVNGETIILEPEDVLLESVSREGTSGVEGGGMLVALNTTLNQELIQEGKVRDIVRNIQELRKNSGLELTDRIQINISGTDAVVEAVKIFSDYIKEETLAEDVFANDSKPATGEIEVELDEDKAKIIIWKS